MFAVSQSSGAVSCWRADVSSSSSCSFSQCEPQFNCNWLSRSRFRRGVWQWRVVVMEATVSGGDREELRRRLNVISSSKTGARERRHQKAAEKKSKQSEPEDEYPPWASILEDACKDDVELREIIGDSFGNPEEMRKRVEDRVRKKGRDILSPKTGSAVPMAVVFKSEFDPLDAFIWLELYADPSDKDLETIGNVLTSWYLLGKLGAFNSMNMQLTALPLNAKYSYSTERASEALESAFHNISDLEFQDNLGRFGIDFGTSDPVAMDVLVNALAAVSTDHVGIKQVVFGGEKLGDWVDGPVDPEDGYKRYKI